MQPITVLPRAPSAAVAGARAGYILYILELGHLMSLGYLEVSHETDDLHTCTELLGLADSPKKPSRYKW